LYDGDKSLTGEIGIQGSFQENVYRGLSLIPSYRNFSGGLFAYERLALERLDIEVGVRADALSQAAYMRDNDYDAHVRRETLNEEACSQINETARCPADYIGTSFSLGTLLHIVPEELDLKVDISSASRFPNVDELYMLGSSPSFPVYALGYPSLKKETVWNSSVTLGFRRDLINAEVAAYGQIIHDYIYFSPELNEDRVPRFDVTIRGTWPRWSYQPIDALFYGMEGQLNIAPQSPIGFRAQGDIVRAEDRKTKDHLVGTPADRLMLTAIARPRIHPFFQGLEIGMTTEIVASQIRVNPDHDVAPPPEGYVLLGGSIETHVGIKKEFTFGLEARNLLNTPYRDYSSLLRYYADQPGRDVRIRIGANF
jgi:iron complex outermembrane receptor protein